MWDAMAHASNMHIRTHIISPVENGLVKVGMPRIGIYDPQHESATDYGWLTLWLERAGFQFERITGEDIVHGALRTIDTLLIPHTRPEILKSAHAGQPYPIEYTRGLSDRVATTLRTWLHRGGHLIAFEGAVSAISEQLGIDLHQPRLNLTRKAFYSSGAIVKVIPASGEEMTLGLDDPIPAMYFSPYGYELRDSGSQHSIAKFASDELVLSGRLHGEKHLAGLHAAVQLNQSEGHFTAFAFRPHFRTQMLASERLLINAISQRFGPEWTKP